MSAEAQRASPQALLALAKEEGRGHLKIFLGAAPGVGKTYAMLTSARTAKTEGRDVVVGLPDGDGKDVIRRMREWPDVPIVVLSGWAILK
jgi:two-component system sensor histidine kinase KdpD